MRKAPDATKVRELADTLDRTFTNPTLDNLHNLVIQARKYERETIINDAIDRISSMRGGLMTPWAVRKSDVTDILQSIKHYK